MIMKTTTKKIPILKIAIFSHLESSKVNGSVSGFTNGLAKTMLVVKSCASCGVILAIDLPRLFL